MSESSSGPGRLSDDGRWWWDGTRWIPASPTPGAERPPIPPARPTPAAPGAGSVPGWLAVLSLLVCVPVGIVLVLLTSWPRQKKALVAGLVGAAVVLVDAGLLGLGALAASRSGAQRVTAGAGTPLPTAPAAPRSSIPGVVAGNVTFGDGAFEVGKDIHPGTYRAPHPSDFCFFTRLKSFGGDPVNDAIAADAVKGPAVVTIGPTDKGFRSDGCRTWTSDLKQVTSSKRSFGEGMYITGVDFEPGTYRASGGDRCYWERLKGFGATFDEVIANGYGKSAGLVTIDASDAGFKSAECGTWTKV